MTHKCGELDKAVPVYIGVSRAILENVIFCHQDESNWPLSEGAVLKKKFDDIFESARYSKALETIRKLKVEYGNKSKDVKADLEGLKAHMEAAKGFKEELEQVEGKRAAIERDVGELDEQERALDEEIGGYTRTLQRFERLEQHIKDAQLRVRDLQTQLKEKLSHMSVMEETDEQLEELLSGMQQQVDDKKRKTTKVEREIKSLRDSIEEDRDTIGQFRQQQGKVEGQIQDQERVERNLAELAKDLAKKHRLTEWRAGEGASSEQQLVAALNRQCDAHEGALAESRERARREDDLMNQELSELSATQQRVKTDLESVQKDRDELTSEQGSVRQRINQMTGIGTGAHSADKVFADVEKMRREIEELRGTAGGRNINTQVQELERACKTLEAEIEALRESADSLRENATEQNDVNAKQSFVEEETERLTGMCDELNDTLGQLLSRTARADHELLQQLNAELETAKADAQRQHGEERERHARARDEKVGAERSHAAKRSECEKLRADVAELESGAVSQMRQALDEFNQAVETEAPAKDDEDDEESGKLPPIEWKVGDDPNQVVERMSTHIAEVVKNHAKSTAETQVADSFLKSVAEKPNKCPCCRQRMEDDVQAKFIGRLEKTKKKFEEQKTRHEGHVRKLTDCKERVSKLSRAVDEFSRKKSQVDELTTELETLDGGRAALERAEEEASTAVNEAAVREADMAKLQNQLDKAMDLSASIERKRSEVNDLQQRIATYTSSLAPGSRSLDEVEREIREKTDAKNAKSGEKDQLQKQLLRQTEQLQVKTEKLADKEREHMRLKESEAEKKQLSDRRTQISELLTQNQTRMAALKDEDAPLNAKIKAKKDEMAQHRARMTREEEELRKQKDEVAQDTARFVDMQEGLNALRKKDSQADLRGIQEQMGVMENGMRTKEAKLAEKEKELDELSKSDEQVETMKKQVEDNMSYRATQEKAAEEQEKLDKLEQDAGGRADIPQVRRSMQDAERRKRELATKRATNMGKVSTLKDSIRTLNEKLKSTTYKGVEERHRSALINFETTKMAVGDLEKCALRASPRCERTHTPETVRPPPPPLSGTTSRSTKRSSSTTRSR